jgi:hypothetical protein
MHKSATDGAEQEIPKQQERLESLQVENDQLNWQGIIYTEKVFFHGRSTSF